MFRSVSALQPCKNCFCSFYFVIPIFCATENLHDTLRRKEMNLVRSYNNWRRYRNTVNELSRLSGRELQDLGIIAADIPAVARKAAM